jgi:hypothetical protein
VAHLVPDELMQAHTDVFVAAALPGVLSAADVVDAADGVVLEVAAVLAGRPPRGAAQRRFVAARVRALNETARELTERHEAFVAARAELDSIAEAITLPDPTPESQSGFLVGLLVVVLFPFFAAWDVVRGITQGAIGLVDGLALRARMVVRVVAQGGRALVDFARTVVQRWADVRAKVAGAAREARHRFVAARVRMRIRVRDARRRWRPTV